MYVDMIQHGLHINKAWTPYGSPANTRMHAVQLNIRSGKTGAGSIHRDCGLYVVDVPDSEVCLCFPIYERHRFNLTLSVWKPLDSV